MMQRCCTSSQVAEILAQRCSHLMDSLTVVKAVHERTRVRDDRDITEPEARCGPDLVASDPTHSPSGPSLVDSALPLTIAH